MKLEIIYILNPREDYGRYGQIGAEAITNAPGELIDKYVDVIKKTQKNITNPNGMLKRLKEMLKGTGYFIEKADIISVYMPNRDD